MSEKLTVAELMARNAKDGARRADRPRRRRNLEDGGVSVSELTGSIPVVSDEDLDQDGADSAAEDLAPVDSHPHQGGHELDDGPEGFDGHDVVEGEVVDEVEEPDEPGEPEEFGGVDTDPAGAHTGETSGDADVAAETTVLPRVDAREESPADADTDAKSAFSDGAAPAEYTDERAGEPESNEIAGQTVPAEEQTEADPDKIIEYEDDAISWPALLGQTALALVIGVVIFFGFTLLWDKLGTALVLIMSGIVTLVCVGVVHALLRHRHTLVLILAFVVGLVITLGPRLIMSI